MNAFSNLLVDVGVWIVDANLKSAVALGLVAAVSCLPRSWLSARWRSGLWLLALLPLVLPIQLPSPTSAWNLLSRSQMVEPSFQVIAVDPPDVVVIPSIAQTPEIASAGTSENAIASTSNKTSEFSWRTVLAAIWLTGTLTLLARLAWLTLRLKQWTAGRPAISDPDLLQMALGCATEAGLARPPRIVDSTDEVGPAVAGWFKPVLLFPRKRLREATTDRLWFILLHEFRHVASRDTLVIVALHALCAINWFNPLVWLARRQWIEEREIACDAWVLSQTGRDSRLDYADMLFWLSSSQKLPAPLLLSAGIISFSTLLERRVLAMRHMNASWRTALAGSMAMLVIGAAAITDRMHAEAAATGETQTPAAEKSSTAETASVSKPERRPLIVAAQHTFLWNALEPMSVEQMQARLAAMRKEGPVKPRIHLSLGSMVPLDDSDRPLESNPEDNAQKRFSDILSAVGEWSYCTILTRRGSKPVDRIKTAQDFQPNPDRVRSGRVVSTSGAPQAGAFVVILPRNDPAELAMQNGALTSPYNEWWAITNEQGEFKIDPLWEDYNVAIVHRNGFSLISNPLNRESQAYEVEPWSEVSMKPDGWSEGDRAYVWVKPDGLDASWPSINVGTVLTATPVVLKSPPGKARAAYFFWKGDGGADTKFRHRFEVPRRTGQEFEAAKSVEVVLPSPSDEDRNVARRGIAGTTADETSKTVSVIDAPKAAAAPVATARDPKKELRPRVVIAQHAILWNGIWPITVEELKSRVDTLRKDGPVKPKIEVSIGVQFPPDDAEGLQRQRTNDVVAAIGGSEQWSGMSFLSRRGSRPVDRVKTVEDLKADPARDCRGQVVNASGTPVAGAYVVILPKDLPQENISLRNGKLSDPYNEWWAVSDARGEFHIDPLCADYRVAIIQENGHAFLNGPLAREGGIYELQPWVDVTVKRPDQWDANDALEIWMSPVVGEDKKWPAFQLASIYGDKAEVTFKAFRGRGKIDYVVKDPHFNIGTGAGTRQPFEVPQIGLEPGQPIVVTPPSLSPEQREEAMKRIKGFAGQGGD